MFQVDWAESHSAAESAATMSDICLEFRGNKKEGETVFSAKVEVSDTH